MNKEQVIEILKGNFTDPEDRQYWEDKLQEITQKEKRIAENEIYYRKMKKYDR